MRKEPLVSLQKTTHQTLALGLVLFLVRNTLFRNKLVRFCKQVILYLEHKVIWQLNGAFLCLLQRFRDKVTKKIQTRKQFNIFPDTLSAFITKVWCVNDQFLNLCQLKGNNITNDSSLGRQSNSNIRCYRYISFISLFGTCLFFVKTNSAPSRTGLSPEFDHEPHHFPSLLFNVHFPLVFRS